MNSREQRAPRLRPAALRPGYLVALAGILVLGMAVFAWYEIREARRIFRSAMEDGAASLVEAVARAGENALRADAELETLVAEGQVDLDAAQRLAFRRAAGVGRLIQEIGENPGVVYVVLQDTAGIVSASQGVKQMSRIVGDPFLEEALSGDQAQSRLTEFAGQEVLETAMAFEVDEETTGLLRIGLSAAALEAEESRVKRRLGLLAGLLVVLGVIGVGLVTVRQNYALLDEAYEQIQTYSTRILEQMADAVVATDPQGQIRVFNQAAERLFNLTAREAQGRTCTDILGGGISMLEQTLETGEEVQHHTCRYRIRQGPEVTLSVSTSLIRDSQGQVETAVAVLQDLTEKVALEADLQRQERLVAMGELAAGVAHEVRNPLNAIGLIAQRLERELAPHVAPEKYLGLTKTVKREVERVNRIIQQFLQFARPPKLVLREADLEEVLEEVIRVVEARVAAKGLQLERHFAGIGQVLIDMEQIKQAVLNLLNNAVEATSSGQIRVTTRLAPEWVEVEVEDTGAGIPPENLERVFNLYFTTKPEGTGLGLSMVHRIAAEHRGRVEVRSEVGKGTAFKLLLPKGG